MIHHATARRLAVAVIALASATASAQQILGPLITVTGTLQDDRLGASVARLGDVDGDGTADFLAGATQATIAGTGLVKVISGATRQVIRTIGGAAAGDYFGGAIANVGDTDGDGRSDFVVSAIGAGPTTSPLNWSGSAYLYSGATGLVRLTIGAGTTGDHQGAAVAGVGDIDNDGVPDFAVSAPGTPSQYATIATPALAGVVRIFSGATGLVIRVLTDGLVGGEFGDCVRSVGDLDGDGVADIAVGAPFGGPQLPNGFRAGAVYLYSGASSALIRILVSPSLTLDGIGRAVAAIGDVDGDQIPDVAVLCTGSVTAGVPNLGAGSMLVYSGASGSVLWTKPTIGARAVSATGDVDGDGVPDVAVGVDTLAAPPILPYPGGVLFLRGSTGSYIDRIDGSSTDQMFGWSLDDGGDLTGDGIGEILVGSMFASPVPGTARAGAVYLASHAGAGTYGVTGGGTVQTLALTWSPITGQTGTIVTSGLTPLGTAWLFASLAPANAPLPLGGFAYIELNQLVAGSPLGYAADATGAAALGVVNIRTPSLAGFSAYLQTAEILPVGSPVPYHVSNGMQVLFMP